MSKPHKHAALIHAWADGATIQALGIDGKTWIDIPNPTWANATYRIKPQSKLEIAIDALEKIAHPNYCGITSHEAANALKQIKELS